MTYYDYETMMTNRFISNGVIVIIFVLFMILMAILIYLYINAKEKRAKMRCSKFHIVDGVCVGKYYSSNRKIVRLKVRKRTLK